VTETPHATVGRNDPCPCGSGRKYKHCCLEKDEAKARTARAKAAAKAAKTEAPAEDTPAPKKPPKPRTEQPWKRSAINTHGFQGRTTSPRKVGGS
jgi:peptidoglycan hydrolase CwlO-like protein